MAGHPNVRSRTPANDEYLVRVLALCSDMTLPWVEVMVGLSLVTGVWRREGAVVAALLLLVFVGAVSAALLRGIDIENCGCFSVTGAGRGAGLKLILGDGAMLAAALAVVRPAAATTRQAESGAATVASA